MDVVHLQEVSYEVLEEPEAQTWPLKSLVPSGDPPEEGPHGTGQGFKALPPSLSLCLLCVSWHCVRGWLCGKSLGVVGSEKWSSLGTDQLALTTIPHTSASQENWARIVMRKATHLISSIAAHL